MAHESAYPTTCPKCGAEMAHIALDPLTAPYLCAGCARGYFSSELTPVARARFRPRHDDWGKGAPAVPVRAAVEREVASARERGTSLRPDQISKAPTLLLRGLIKRGGLSTEFLAAVQAEVDLRGAK